MSVDFNTTSSNSKDALERLIQIIKLLRTECPWDRQQTHQSLRGCLIEEAYETVEAIDKDDMDNLKEELGDVLLQVVFHGMLGEESKSFTITDIINDECEKMIRRHPHVFLKEGAKTIDKAIEKWENIKISERKEKKPGSIIEEVPKSFPALLRTYKIQKKAKPLNSEDRNIYVITSELEGRVKGLASLNKKDHDLNAEMIGNLLFQVVELAEALGIEPEGALRNKINDYAKEFGRFK